MLYSQQGAEFHWLSCLSAPKLNFDRLLHDCGAGTLHTAFLVRQRSRVGSASEGLNPSCLFLSLLFLCWFLTMPDIFFYWHQRFLSVSAVKHSLQFSKTHKIRLRPPEDLNIAQPAVSVFTDRVTTLKDPWNSADAAFHGAPLPRVYAWLIPTFFLFPQPSECRVALFVIC